MLPGKRKAGSSNASEIRNPYVIKFSKRGVVNPDALQVQPTSNPHLQWNGSSDIEKQAYNARLAKLQVRNIATPKLVDWGVLDEIGIHLELTKIFRIRFKEDDELVFTCRAWLQAFKVKEDVYKKWCLEFFSTLWVDEQIKVENITSEVCIWFRLCGKNYEYTLLDFVVLLGLYMEDEIKEPKLGAYLEAGEMNFDKFHIKSFWEIISKNDKGRKNEVSLRDPKLKLIHRLLVNMVLRRDYSRDELFSIEPPERGIKKCSSPLKSGWLDKKAFARLIDKETNKLLPPDDDDEEDEDEQEIEHEENVEQEENVGREALVQQKDGFEEMSRRMSEIYGMVSRLTYQIDYFKPILTHYSQAHNLTMTPPYNPPGVPGMRFPMYPPPSPPTNSDAVNIGQASSSQNVGGVDTSIVGSMGHGNDDVGARPSHVTNLVEYADGMDEDDV
ncbi:hypothetical protein Tco_0396466 [Tanacetum coccineum]